MSLANAAALIAEAEREIRMRNRVYPSMVARGKKTQEDADRQIGLMREIVDVIKNITQPALPLGQALASEQEKLQAVREKLLNKQQALDAIWPFCDRDLRSIESSMTANYLRACHLVKLEIINNACDL